jgi:glutaredoxin/glutathione-dependent peroxiredoxin
MIKTGDRLPDATFKVRVGDDFVDKTTNDIFSGKKVVLFAVPGAFTPTCSVNHLPGYIENRDVILGKGIDNIAVVAVNDHYVMKAWAESAHAVGKITFLADGNGDFAKAIGLDIDLSGGGLAVRSKRYSMIVDNGVVTVLNIEENPGVATVSGAAAILGQI